MIARSMNEIEHIDIRISLILKYRPDEKFRVGFELGYRFESNAQLNLQLSNTHSVDSMMETP